MQDEVWEKVYLYQSDYLPRPPTHTNPPQKNKEGDIETVELQILLTKIAIRLTNVNNGEPSTRWSVDVGQGGV